MTIGLGKPWVLVLAMLALHLKRPIHRLFEVPLVLGPTSVDLASGQKALGWVLAAARGAGNGALAAEWAAARGAALGVAGLVRALAPRRPSRGLARAARGAGLEQRRRAVSRGLPGRPGSVE